MKSAIDVASPEHYFVRLQTVTHQWQTFTLDISTSAGVVYHSQCVLLLVLFSLNELHTPRIVVVFFWFFFFSILLSSIFIRRCCYRWIHSTPELYQTCILYCTMLYCTHSIISTALPALIHMLWYYFPSSSWMLCFCSSSVQPKNDNNNFNVRQTLFSQRHVSL